MIISPFTPLIFEPHRGDGLPCRYIQTFAPTDTILIECIFGSGESTVDFYLSKVDSDWSHLITMQTWTINSRTRLLFCELRLLDDDMFYIHTLDHSIESRPFRVTSDESELAKTVLLQYRSDGNTSRSDVVFEIEGQRRFFDFRVPGGFKDTDWTFEVDAEQFTTSHGDPVTLYARENLRKRLTVGCADGVPIEFADKINRLLCCQYVYLDGVRYSRAGTSVPEATAIGEGKDAFIVKVELQKVANLDAQIDYDNMIILRRDYDTTNYRSATISNTDYNLMI